MNIMLSILNLNDIPALHIKLKADDNNKLFLYSYSSHC